MFRTVHRIDPVKMVVFDLDDTLWRGQLAEHYGDDQSWPQVHGWPVGMWDAVLQLRQRGILTAICSKNDQALVHARWGRACSWLTAEDFTLAEVNWRPKAENVGALMRKANLTARNVVFVDDNPVEREAVHSAFPDLRVIGSNPYLTRRILLWSSETQVPFLTDESSRRDEMVRAQQRREEERAVLSREAFLESLDCRVDIRTIITPDDAELPRALELINKSNQFNTTGKRHSFSEVAAFLADGGRIYTFEATDRFTRYGLVGAILFRDGCFVQFAMSCRVLGLDIETGVIGQIIDELAAAGEADGLTAHVRSTDANMVSRDVYQRVGFVVAEKGGTGTFQLIGPPAPPPAHLRIALRAATSIPIDAKL